MPKPVAVLGADIHYSINTLELADAATKQMVAEANRLRVPFVIAGDLHDTKSFHRDECQSAMLRTLSSCWLPPVVLIGNHCRRNEKSPEHALTFLETAVEIVDHPISFSARDLKATMIPYQHDAEDFKKALIKNNNSLVICHQGIVGADMGHYIQDKSAIIKEDVADYRVISGHYHKRQDIKCGRPRKGALGLFSYVGNPYSLTFGEAKDPPKGFQVLMDNGILEFIPTNLRKHVVCEIEAKELSYFMHSCTRSEFLGINGINSKDLLWIKVTGTRGEQHGITKKSVSDWLRLENFKLDLVPKGEIKPECSVEDLSHAQLMDAVIDVQDELVVEKEVLKKLWREVIDEDFKG